MKFNNRVRKKMIKQQSEIKLNRVEQDENAKIKEQKGNWLEQNRMNWNRMEQKRVFRTEQKQNKIEYNGTEQNRMNQNSIEKKKKQKYKYNRIGQNNI